MNSNQPKLGGDEVPEADMFSARTDYDPAQAKKDLDDTVIDPKSNQQSKKNPEIKVSPSGSPRDPNQIKLEGLDDPSKKQDQLEIELTESHGLTYQSDYEDPDEGVGGVHVPSAVKASTVQKTPNKKPQN